MFWLSINFFKITLVYILCIISCSKKYWCIWWSLFPSTFFQIPWMLFLKTKVCWYIFYMLVRLLPWYFVHRFSEFPYIFLFRKKCWYIFCMFFLKKIFQKSCCCLFSKNKCWYRYILYILSLFSLKFSQKFLDDIFKNKKMLVFNLLSPALLESVGSIIGQKC